KRILHRIREQCEDPGTASAVYVALTVVASDVQKEEFQTTHQWLAGLSGFCEKTVRSRLADLQRIGVVAITTLAMRAPCTYKLLPFGSNCRTSGNGCRTFGNATPLSVTEIRRNKEEPISVTVTEQNGSPFKALRKDIALG